MKDFKDRMNEIKERVAADDNGFVAREYQKVIIAS
jgi:hypothetical protein